MAATATIQLSELARAAMLDRNYTVIDFETADNTRTNPCEIGLTRIRNGEIIDTKSWYIKPDCYPHFNYWCTRVHGIYADDVADAPKWPEVWMEVRDYLADSIVVAHNASFDMGVLRSTNEFYGLLKPSFHYFCTVTLARRAWKQIPKHGLESLAKWWGLKPGGHRAGADAEVTAKLLLMMLDDYKGDMLGLLRRI